MKIAFLGLGNMGSGIARNIERAGHQITVWNRSPAKADVFKDSSAKIAARATDAAAESDIVVTSLMDDKSVLDLMVGDLGVIEAMKPGAAHLCVTTISPDCATELEKLHGEYGTHYVSGPVVGRPDAAAAGMLTTLLGGNAQVVERLKPVCESYSDQVVFVGERPASANVIKLGMNYMAVASIEILSEIYAMVEANDTDTSLLAHFFAEQLYAHPALKMYTRKIQARDFAGDAGFAMSAGLKDVRLMIAAAKSKGVDIDIARIIEGKMMEAVNTGMADKDWSSIYEVTRKRAGLN
jgi:3-hydroxyisobutyrate dehydrogenase-like beta-hydroxyacid dehydrogenase